MTQYAANNKQAVRLGALLGKGGEGEVYLVEGAGDRVAKIYHVPHRTAQRQHKLQAMLANPPQDDTRRLTPPHVSIAWPLEVLYERQQFAGFLMPRIDQSPTIFTIFNPNLRNRRYPAFDWRYLHRTAANLAVAMNALHVRGYVVGDVNQKNVLVTPSAMVTWVDTDSFQVPDTVGRSTRQVYRCPVGVPDYTPPELQGVNLSTVDRQTEHDCFGLAVMIFQLLMQGYHPFTGILQSGVAAPTGEIFRHNIERGIFPHQPNPQCIPPPAAPALAALHPTLQQLFIRAFVDGHHKPPDRPTAREWLDGIGRAEQMLVQCKQDPAHWSSSHYGQCHWCVPHSQSKTAPPLQNPLPPAAKPPAAKPPALSAPKKRTTYRNFIVGGIIVAGLAFFQIPRFLPALMATMDSQTNSTQIKNMPLSPTTVPVLQPDGASSVKQIEEILIPAGEFVMGSPDGEAENNKELQHTVYLNDYLIDKYEVTNAYYQMCVDASECTTPQNTSSSTRTLYYGTDTYADYPVINVTWNQARAFCAWAGKRLPTEAEWEKAARGSDTRKYPWGDSAPGCTKTNYDWCVDDTSRVGSYPSGASPYGVMDMAGNVWEWVNDWYDDSYYSVSPLSNPQGPTTGTYRVLRGGSWDRHDFFIRAAYRGRGSPQLWDGDYGFRCARSQ